MRAAVAEMLAQGVITPSPLSTLPVPRPIGRLFTIEKAPGKLAIVFDLKSFNKTQPARPPATRLPSLTDIQRAILSLSRSSQGRPLLMAKIDITRFYDSMVLPYKTTKSSWPQNPSSFPLFTFYFEGTIYRYNRLPFGWDFAPYIAQNTSLTLVRRACAQIRPTSMTYIFTYMDDILILGSAAFDVQLATSAVVASVESAGFIINRNKSVIKPTSKLSFLGHTFDLSIGGSPSSASESSTLLSILHLGSSLTPNPAPVPPPVLLSPLLLSPSSVLALVGLIVWSSRRSLPFLQPVFRYLCCFQRSPRRPVAVRPSVSSALRSAASFAARDHWSSSRWVPIPRPILRCGLPPSATFFCDASASRGLAGAVSLDGVSLRRVWRVPCWVFSRRFNRHDAQQSAELFALTETLVVALSLGVPALVVADSTSSVAAVLRFSSGAFSPHRARLLRRLALACVAAPHHDISFAFVPSQQNPADCLTFDPPNWAMCRHRLGTLDRILPVPGLPPRPCLRHTAVTPAGPTALAVRFHL